MIKKECSKKSEIAANQSGAMSDSVRFCGNGQSIFTTKRLINSGRTKGLFFGTCTTVFAVVVSVLIFYGCKKDGNNDNGNNTTQLSAPTGVQATKNGSTISISWGEVSGATEYFVYRSNSADGTYTSLSSTSGTSVIDAMPMDGDNYYKVKASNGSTTSDYSNFAYCQYSSGGGGGGLSAPTGVSATQSSNNIIVSWNSVSGAAYYLVYYGSSSSAPSYYIDQQISSTSFTIAMKDEAASGDFYFWVKAFNSSAESNFSNYAYCHYSYGGGGGGGDTKPNAPTGVSASQSGTSVYVSWNSSTGATSYKVYRSSSSSGTYSLMGTSYSTSYSDNSPISGYNYYKITAVNSAGESTQSSYASCNYSSGGGGGTTYSPCPVTYGNCTANSTTITMRWTVPTTSGCGTPTTTYLRVRHPDTGDYVDLQTLSGTTTSASFSYGMWIGKGTYDKGYVYVGIITENEKGKSGGSAKVYDTQTGKWIN